LLAEGRQFEAKGEFERAYQDFTDVVKLGQDLAKNGVLIHYLVRTNIERMAFRVIRNSLKKPDASRELYAKVAHRLEELAAGEVPTSQALRWEFACCERGIRRIVNKSYERLAQEMNKEMMRFPPLSLFWAPLVVLLPTRWTQHVFEGPIVSETALWLCYPPNTEKAIANIRRYGEEAARCAERPYAEGVKTPLLIPNDPISRMTLPAYDRILMICTAYNVEAEATRAMVALVAYKKLHGRYPEALDAIVSNEAHVGLLSKMPMDAFSGKPLCYRPVGDGFVLYSVGPDLEDDKAERECPIGLEAGAKGDIVYRLNQ
jgi:hypothetical protein